MTQISWRSGKLLVWDVTASAPQQSLASLLQLTDEERWRKWLPPGNVRSTLSCPWHNCSFQSPWRICQSLYRDLTLPCFVTRSLGTTIRTSSQRCYHLCLLLFLTTVTYTTRSVVIKKIIIIRKLSTPAFCY